MKMIKLAVLIIFVYMLTHLFSFTLFIMRPLWIEPEKIKKS